MIMLKLLVLIVITNVYGISNGIYDLKFLNIICKALERRYQVFIQKKDIDMDHHETYVIEIHIRGIIYT